MVKKSVKNSRYKNKKKKRSNKSKKIKRMIGGQISSQNQPNMRQMGHQISSQKQSNMRQMGDQMTSQMRPNMRQMGDQMTSSIIGEAKGIVKDVVYPAYKDAWNTSIDTFKKLAIKEYDTRIAQLGIINEAAKKMIGTSERFQQRAEETGKKMENIIDNVGEQAFNKLSEQSLNTMLQQYQQGGRKIKERVENSKQNFIDSSSELPLNLMMDIPV
jgi:hypothetical protein